MKLLSQAVPQYVSAVRYTIVGGCGEEMLSLIVLVLPRPQRNMLLHSPLPSKVISLQWVALVPDSTLLKNCIWWISGAWGHPAGR